ncbi:hypothetical protein FRB95_010431 [Tulasnella sp. JGI-2019a]|nr:hypothetical protein FRB93_004579 [Tulasnella sp. JGI-2019a]KAG9035837.1 hypothetical protein FRB95_010431 [Tulasnella sp. JGI-2019a]
MQQEQQLATPHHLVPSQPRQRPQYDDGGKSKDQPLMPPARIVPSQTKPKPTPASGSK